MKNEKLLSIFKRAVGVCQAKSKSEYVSKGVTRVREYVSELFNE